MSAQVHPTAVVTDPDRQFAGWGIRCLDGFEYPDGDAVPYVAFWSGETMVLAVREDSRTAVSLWDFIERELDGQVEILELEEQLSLVGDAA